MTEARLLRAGVFHTPGDPFREAGALEAWSDGGVLVSGERVLARGDFEAVRRAHPEAEVVDLRPGLLLPGFVDTHVHYPQLPIIGSMGRRLLQWLEARTLPEEAKLADPERARAVARAFLTALLRNGTTTALVFGSHFPAAQDILFEEAEAARVRLTSGLVLADRNLLPELHLAPEAAHAASLDLARRWHGRGRLRYAVTPRFALSASEGLLEVSGALMGEPRGLYFQTHLNENPEEVAAVGGLFSWAPDYLGVYERFGLVSERSVFAHNVHAGSSELDRLAHARAAVAHCPSSNAFLGSGLFGLTAHLERGVRVALGSDVGAGTGFSMLKEGLAAYGAQMLRPDGYGLCPPHLLFLATRAGALALGLGDTVGDLSPGKAADLVLIRPPPGSTLEAVLAMSDSPDETLGAVFTLAREESVAEVWLAGRPVLTAPGRA